MKWATAITAALCALPLAFASPLEAELVEKREPEIKVDTTQLSNGANIQVSGASSGTVVEVIILWVNNGGGAQTTTMTSASKVNAAAASSATHTVLVGGAGGLTYTPNSLSAAVGDTVVFVFLASNHTATQSAFDKPCVKLAGGMDSGFMPNVNNSVVPAPMMAMQVTVATPIWFYCRQKNPTPHCGKGMTFSINPTANKTQAMFQQMAIAQNGTGTAAAIVGGAANSVAATSSAVLSTQTAVANSGSTSNNAGNMAAGSGAGAGGTCSCSCLCGVSSFPVAAQGVGAVGGMSGAIPMAAMMA